MVNIYILDLYLDNITGSRKKKNNFGRHDLGDLFAILERLKSFLSIPNEVPI